MSLAHPINRPTVNLAAETVDLLRPPQVGDNFTHAMRHVITGLPISAGIAIGRAHLFRQGHPAVEPHAAPDSLSELERLQQALAQTRADLKLLLQHAQLEVSVESASIFEAHELFLDDPEYLGLIEDAIRRRRLNVEAAVDEATEHFARQLLALDSPEFQVRAADIRDVGAQLLAHLSGRDDSERFALTQPAIIVADELAPSDTLRFDRAHILGIVTRAGGPTSHTAILARSLGIPAVTSVNKLDLASVNESALLIMDGQSGRITLSPTDVEVAQAQHARQAWLDANAISSAQQPAITLDGRRVYVAANIGGLADAQRALAAGVEGIGLFRTEMAFLDRADLPDADEQENAYRAIAEVMHDRPLVARTFDIGGDKSMRLIGAPREANPFLGERGIRLARAHPHLLLAQIRALLRGCAKADLRIMLPMVSNLSDVEFGRAIFEQARAELSSAGVAYAERAQLGIMIEVPAAAILASRIAPLVDFFSIGSNDLAQYTVAADRGNARVAALASPYHPAVLQLIQQSVDAAHAHGKWCGLCGEMAGDPLATWLLLGMGLDEFSMSVGAIPAVKARIRRATLAHCRALAASVLALDSTEAIAETLARQ